MSRFCSAVNAGLSECAMAHLPIDTAPIKVLRRSVEPEGRFETPVRGYGLSGVLTGRCLL
jgi:hypothetical protein